MRLVQGTAPTVVLGPAGGHFSEHQGPHDPMATPVTLAALFLTPPLPLTIQLLFLATLCSHCPLWPLWFLWL